MLRELTLTEADAVSLAGHLRSLSSYGQSLLSSAQVAQACEWADKLYPLPGGPWRPEGWYGATLSGECVAPMSPERGSVERRNPVRDRDLGGSPESADPSSSLRPSTEDS